VQHRAHKKKLTPSQSAALATTETSRSLSGAGPQHTLHWKSSAAAIAWTAPKQKGAALLKGLLVSGFAG
jgi:hypothetical protein